MSRHRSGDNDGKPAISEAFWGLLSISEAREFHFQMWLLARGC
jgi:hypothetical protein